MYAWRKTFDHDVNTLLHRTRLWSRLLPVPWKSAMSPGANGTNGGIKEMNENIDIDTTFVPDDSASHSWTERDSELVEEYAAQLMAMSI